MQDAGILKGYHWRFALVAIATLVAGPLKAATFPNLFTVTVAPDPAVTTARDDAIDRAMRILLTRVSGRVDAASYPELAALVEQAPSLMTSYADFDDGSIRVGFNGSVVRQALEAASWPVWGAERPLTLLWVAIDFGNGQRALLSEQADIEGLDGPVGDLVDSIREELLRAADERGLPVVWPLLDLEDFQLISFAEVWGGFDPLIERASARYAADAALVARIAVTEFGLSIRWSLLQGGQTRVLPSSSTRDGIDWAAGQFATEYSSIGGARLIRLAIEGVDSLVAYARVMSYLESVSVLETVDVASYEGDVLSLRVAAHGDENLLERVLTLEGVLASVADAASGFGAPLTLRATGGGR
jgi:hypothetical protein